MSILNQKSDQSFEFIGKNVGIFMIHDLTGSPQNLMEIGEIFAEAGYSVQIPCLLGHDENEEVLQNKTIDEIYHKLYDEFNSFSDQLEYTILFGFATGGAFAQQIASNNEIAGLILLNSLFAPPEKLVSVAMNSSEITLPTGTIDIKNNRAKVKVFENVPVSLIKELAEVSSRLFKDAVNIHAPVLILQSIDDHVYAPKDADQMLTKIGSREKHLVMLYDSYHYAPVDYDQERIANQSLFFIKGLDPRRED